MAHSDETEWIPVVDSDGVRGALAAGALHQTGEQVFITFQQGRVQVPRTLLQRQEDGSYVLPFRLRDLEDRSTQERSQDRDVVAVVPVIAEHAQIGTREVETGRVRVRKTVQTVEEQVDVPLLRESVQVERVAVDRTLAEPATVRQEGDTLVIPVMEEVLVVEKRLILREEIRISTVRERLYHKETVPLQREQVVIEREDSGRTA